MISNWTSSYKKWNEYKVFSFLSRKNNNKLILYPNFRDVLWYKDKKDEYVQVDDSNNRLKYK